MNQDMISKMVPFLSKKSILMLYGITRDPKYPVYIIRRYKARLNIIPTGKAAMLIQRAVDMERNDLVMEYLCHVPPGRMTRILLKLAENIEPEKTQHMISDLKKSNFCLMCSSNNRCEVIVARIENIVKNIRSYAYHCK
ncbi:uncharacterized protein Eint_090070 [Encephalitozoon intestinalis ATCC 50506]|uniref:Uncharacterized protein n=1 Tax=Encephalitozoon intestinalis (strain ATCC 50506) TaxID=876142 RepID=E0S920_ENCIT|nr:uncharacterized protein Eint_090070 [Encephalitozoon intestinalis ATCC 50506]ADM12137.1 hypothetical protein Eint_090070 [Encephalitozoon intestinalis ATCC 50506]UTX45938.1 hypothetical protein GPK93_09g15230 [Encephalitozoon intestinalis]